jgi:Fe2+ transport system protein FeoA
MNHAKTIPLTDLAPGAWCALQATDLQQQDRDLLAALGLPERARFRICKSGDPFIVQVSTTRIGLAQDVARRLMVLPDLSSE